MTLLQKEHDLQHDDIQVNEFLSLNFQSQNDLSGYRYTVQNSFYTGQKTIYLAGNTDGRYFPGHKLSTVIVIYTASVSWPVAGKKKRQPCPVRSLTMSFTAKLFPSWETLFPVRFLFLSWRLGIRVETLRFSL